MSQQENRADARPSMVFATVLDAYAKSGQANAAESLFNRMTDSQHIGANTISYNTVLNALTKSKDRDAPLRAEALLNRMQEEYEAGNRNVRPNSISFSCLLNCWARSSQEGAAEHAEAILTRMEQLGNSGHRHVQPNAVCYSTVLNAWARSRSSDSGNRAVALLTRMEEAYRKGQNFSKPNSYCYNTTINAIAKSSHPDKALRAYDLLHRMIQAYENGNHDAKPSVRSFSTVLNACAYTHGTPEDKTEAFRIARKTFAELLESDYGDPSVVTYVNFLTACAKLLPRGKSRDAMMGAVFRDCSERGFTNDKVVSILQSAVPPDVFRQNTLTLKGTFR